MKNNSTTKSCQIWSDFQDSGIEKVSLLIGYGITGLLIISLNLVLIRALSKQPRTRATMLLLVLSISDVGVGFFTIPFTMLRFVNLSKNVLCDLLPSIMFFSYFPFSFSYGVTTIISIDRCLMVTKSNFHTKYMTTGIITFKLIALFVICLAGSIMISITSFHVNPKVAGIFYACQLVIQFTIIMVTCYLNLKLYCFVKQTSQQMAASRHEGTQESYCSRMTKTISYIFICMLFFTGTQVIIYGVISMVNMRNIIRRNLAMWGLLLLFSNSYINVIILLARSSNLRYTTPKNKRKVNISSTLHFC